MQNEAAFRAAPELFPPREAGALVSATRAALDRIKDLVLQRGGKGWCGWRMGMRISPMLC
ncbi:hypothetical protein V6L77_15795 [Pannonibacter sp. Pt2-lr]